MLCSGCGQPIKPVVAVDIDGTLGDYHAHFIRFATGYLNVEYLPAGRMLYGGGEPFRAWFTGTFGVDDRTFRDIKLAYRQGAQKRSMPAYPGAAEFVNHTMFDGAEVWLTTTRPYLKHDSIDPDTRAWLDRHSIGYNYLLYGPDKYRDLRERVEPERVVAVVDDLVWKLDEAHHLFGDVTIKRATIWNRENTWHRNIDDLRAGTALLKARLSEWREQHGR